MCIRDRSRQIPCNYRHIPVAVSRTAQIFPDRNTDLAHLLTLAGGLHDPNPRLSLIRPLDVYKRQQLLWINLVTYSLPAIALGMEAVPADVMEKKLHGKQRALLPEQHG